MGKNQRIDKILSHMGYGSRKDISKMCKAGLVVVNDKVVKDSSIHVDSAEDKILVGNELVKYREFVYIMMNKPAGVISATYDNTFETVVDLLDDSYKSFKVFPVGRLDKDTEGLLLLTNDGKLSHNLLSPKKHVPKTYYAIVEGRVGQEEADIFKEGVQIDNEYKTLPAELKILKSDEKSEIELTIYEGKFHQVKRMFEAVKMQVIYLKRLSMGNLILDENIKPGEYRELLGEELEALKI